MTRNTALLLGATAALGVAACTPDATSIQVQYVIGDQPTSACVSEPSDVQRGSGSVDLAYTSSYVAAFQVVSWLNSKDLTAGGETVNPASRNNFTFESATLSYTAAGLSLAPQHVGAGGMVKPGETLAVPIDLLSSGMANSLINKYFAALGTGLQHTTALSVSVSVKFSGKFANGSAYETAPFGFPLTVHWSKERACPLETQQLVAVSGGTAPACSNWGQDSSKFGVDFSCGCTDCNGLCPSRTAPNNKCDTTSCDCTPCGTCGVGKQCDTTSAACVCMSDCGGCSSGKTCDTASCTCK